jgi:hypothetical protein
MLRDRQPVFALMACLSVLASFVVVPSRHVQAQERKLPKVSRSFWGPTTLDYKGRYKLLDEPDQCKGKEYKMEVKYDGGGTRKGGKLEDCECTVFTDGNSYTMEFSFPSDLKQPNIQVGDYLVLSFVFSGATKSFFSQPNVVTAVERTKK